MEEEFEEFEEHPQDVMEQYQVNRPGNPGD